MVVFICACICRFGGSSLGSRGPRPHDHGWNLDILLGGVQKVRCIRHLKCHSADSLTPLAQLRVDGGMANELHAFQSDVLNVPCLRPSVLETTALGSAFLAGLGVGFWSSTEAISSAWRLSHSFEPQLTSEERAIHQKQWSHAVAKA